MEKIIYCVKVMLAIVSVLLGVYTVCCSSGWIMWSLVALFFVNLILPDTIYQASVLFVSACVSLLFYENNEFAWSMVVIVIEMMAIVVFFTKAFKKNLKNVEYERDYDNDEYISGNNVGMAANFIWCAVLFICIIAKFW